MQKVLPEDEPDHSLVAVTSLDIGDVAMRDGLGSVVVGQTEAVFPSEADLVMRNLAASRYRLHATFGRW